MQNFNPVSLAEEKYPELKEFREGFVKQAIAPAVVWGLAALAGATGLTLGALPYIKTWFYPKLEEVRKIVGEETSKTAQGILAPVGGGLLGAGLGYLATQNEKNRLRNAILGGLLGLGGGYLLPKIMPSLMSNFR